MINVLIIFPLMWQQFYRRGSDHCINIKATHSQTHLSVESDSVSVHQQPHQSWMRFQLSATVKHLYRSHCVWCNLPCASVLTFIFMSVWTRVSRVGFQCEKIVFPLELRRFFSLWFFLDLVWTFSFVC